MSNNLIKSKQIQFPLTGSITTASYAATASYLIGTGNNVVSLEVFNQFTASVDLDYITNNGNLTDNKIIVGSLDVELTDGFIEDIFLVKSASFEAVKVENDGVWVLGDFTTKPDPRTGALVFSQDNLWVGSN